MFGLLLAIAFGAIFGSYATLFAYRLPLGESCFGRYFGAKSRCPSCNAIIKTRDLIPVINWLVTFGRCRNCSTKIPRTHLFIELTTTILFATCYLKFSFSEQFIIYALISVCLTILLVTDYTHKTFPNPILNLIVIAGICGRILTEGTILNVTFCAAMAVICATIFYHIFYKTAQHLFTTQQQAFDYIKMILISGAILKLGSFLLYFAMVMLIMSLFVALNIPEQVRDKRKNLGFGYVFILPLLALLFFA